MVNYREDCRNMGDTAFDYIDYSLVKTNLCITEPNDAYCVILDKENGELYNYKEFNDAKIIVKGKCKSIRVFYINKKKYIMYLENKKIKCEIVVSEKHIDRFIDFLKNNNVIKNIPNHELINKYLIPNIMSIIKKETNNRLDIIDCKKEELISNCLLFDMGMIISKFEILY